MANQMSAKVAIMIMMMKLVIIIKVEERDWSPSFSKWLFGPLSPPWSEFLVPFKVISPWLQKQPSL